MMPFKVFQDGKCRLRIVRLDILFKIPWRLYVFWGCQRRATDATWGHAHSCRSLAV